MNAEDINWSQIGAKSNNEVTVYCVENHSQDLKIKENHREIQFKEPSINTKTFRCNNLYPFSFFRCGKK